MSFQSATLPEEGAREEALPFHANRECPAPSVVSQLQRSSAERMKLARDSASEAVAAALDLRFSGLFVFVLLCVWSVSDIDAASLSLSELLPPALLSSASSSSS